MQTDVSATATLDQYYQVLAKTNSNVVWEILRQSDKFYEWNHYPKEDVYDSESHSQYFYHAHALNNGSRWKEHGHFHLFIRQKGIPSQYQAKPLLAHQLEGKTDSLCHLFGISMDKYGKPIRLFTTNRWVTGETWYAAADTIALIKLFEITHAWPSWPTNLWLNHMTKIHYNTIAKLIYQRDEVIEQWQNKHSDINVYEDRRLEITSYSEC